MGQALSGCCYKIDIATENDYTRLGRDYGSSSKCASLKMLQTDYVDLYQFHQVVNDEESGENYERQWSLECVL